jgi:mono/diheme cytochrome c family protein
MASAFAGEGVTRAGAGLSGRNAARSEGVVGRLVKLVLLGLAIAFLAIQVVPYGRSHTNPPVAHEPDWESPSTRQLALAACYDCHSNETRWPWYSHLAPMSWLLQNDVEAGRATLNFSEWDRPQEEADEAAETVSNREMPPWTYTVLHAEARLSPSDREALVRGLDATFGGDAEDGGVSRRP